METRETMAAFLAAIAGDLRSGKPIISAIDDLEEAIEEWREQFDRPEDGKE